jgi:hypothetical protein
MTQASEPHTTTRDTCDAPNLAPLTVDPTDAGLIELGRRLSATRAKCAALGERDAELDASDATTWQERKQADKECEALCKAMRDIEEAIADVPAHTLRGLMIKAEIADDYDIKDENGYWSALAAASLAADIRRLAASGELAVMPEAR